MHKRSIQTARPARPRTVFTALILVATKPTRRSGPHIPRNIRRATRRHRAAETRTMTTPGGTTGITRTDMALAGCRPATPRTVQRQGPEGAPIATHSGVATETGIVTIAIGAEPVDVGDQHDEGGRRA